MIISDFGDKCIPNVNLERFIVGYAVEKRSLTCVHIMFSSVLGC